MKTLERFPEPWIVTERDGGFTATGANGVYLLGVGHREDLHKSNYTMAGRYLSRQEAEGLARAIANLKPLMRRPTY
jgi:hypothetical protein